jgi:hypothetical protein
MPITLPDRPPANRVWKAGSSASSMRRAAVLRLGERGDASGAPVFTEPGYWRYPELLVALAGIRQGWNSVEGDQDRDRLARA